MNKPVVKTGGLGNFKENIIYEKEKNNSFKSSEDFKASIYKKYKHIATSDLYKKIVNYQVKTFGEALTVKVLYLTQEERIKLNDKANRRRYLKLKGRKSDEKYGVH